MKILKTQLNKNNFLAILFFFNAGSKIIATSSKESDYSNQLDDDTSEISDEQDTKHETPKLIGVVIAGVGFVFLRVLST